MKRLIINADDTGAAEGTVEAMEALHAAGVLTSVSPLVNLPDWPKAAAYLREHPDLGAGVHLVMNDGKPILPPAQVPSLVDHQGKFYEGNALLLRFGRLKMKELEAEWRAQVEKFCADTGRQPDHLDLHCQYPYMISSWFEASLKVAKAFGGLPVRLPFDAALDQKAAQMGRDNGFPGWYIRWAGHGYRRTVSRYGLKSPDYFESSFSLTNKDNHRTAEYLLGRLDALPEGTTELLGHPGLNAEWRRQDFQAMLDPRVRQRIADLGIQLITFRDL